MNDTTKAQIRDLIADVEMHCDSELVCLITKNSARYVLYPVLVAAVLALLLPALQVIADLFGGMNLRLQFHHQTIAFAGLAILFTFTPLGLLVTPKWLQRQNCARFSAEQFFRQQLHETRGRSAILIFVSWDEKYVTIVADKGINDRVQQSDWDALIARFVSALKANDVEQGFLSIISGAGALLKAHFPVQGTKTDELPNHLIELDGAPYIS